MTYSNAEQDCGLVMAGNNVRLAKKSVTSSGDAYLEVAKNFPFGENCS